MTLPDGREGRAIGVSFFPYIDREDHPEIKTPRGVQVVLARDRSEMPSILGALVIGLFSVLLLTASGILVVVPPLVLAGLRPLKQLADRTASIDLKYPGFRYPGDNLPDELRPIVDRLNGLLQRIEDAFSREKRLSADMAHELKTPVAELRSLAEVALRWPEDSAFVHDALRNTIEIAQEMDRRISVLLALSRNESGEQHVSLSDVDLSGLIRDLWIPWEKMAKEKRIRTKLDIPSIAVVTTDSGMLSSILTNLFSNAVEYCPEGGRFTCSMEQGPEKVRLTMINSNNTLTEEDLPKIFDYLWRKDPARTDGSHIGLGLVLVESFARILDIPIKAELLQGGDFCMTLEISAFSSGEGTTKEES
jgi:two-component system sensor histidine kinase QseC